LVSTNVIQRTCRDGILTFAAIFGTPVDIAAAKVSAGFQSHRVIGVGIASKRTNAIAFGPARNKDITIN
jgi:hypothetical protein